MNGYEPTPVMRDAVIGRRTAASMSVVFTVLIIIPPAHQLVTELRRTGRWSVLSLFRQLPTHASLKECEEALARDSDLAARVRKRYQSVVMHAVGQGNEKVFVGRDGFLFFRKEVEMASGPGFLSRQMRHRRGTGDGLDENAASDPVRAIVDYHRQLQARGIRLVFIPLPVKPFLYPEKVWAGYPAPAGPAWNRDREPFKAKLRTAGVDVLDVTDDLWGAKSEGEIFLRLDTHWSPLGLQVAADRIADHLRPLVGPAREPVLSRKVRVTNGGDLLRMMDGIPSGTLFLPQTVEVAQVPAPPGEVAPVLVLGDSFANIYSRKELEWGEHGGLGDQLMLRLGVRVQVLALNGGGATAARQILRRKPEFLREKQVVVWACSARDLFDESVRWDTVPLPEWVP
ncbi:MAG TPA: hypothetical protein VKU80_06995 [Planctomycetota bacterium]|nr:hypothetical protein [Planctomycetota bacterium]